MELRLMVCSECGTVIAVDVEEFHNPNMPYKKCGACGEDTMLKPLILQVDPCLEDGEVSATMITNKPVHFRGKRYERT